MRILSSLMVAAGLAIALPLVSDGAAEPKSALDYSTVMEDVRAFLGPMRGDYVLPGARVFEQVDAAMSLPRPTLDVGSNRSFITGCRAHSCLEKAAVLVDSERKALAVALISARCGERGCRDTHVLTVFAPFESIDRALLEPFVDWSETVRPDYFPESRLHLRAAPFASIEFEFRSTRVGAGP